MEVVGPLTSSVMSCLCMNDSVRGSLIKKCKNLRRPTRELEKLKTLMYELDSRNRGLNNKLDQIWVEEGKKPTVIVKVWMRHVDQIKSEVNSLINEIEQHGIQPRAHQFCLRIKLGERIEEKIQSINDLLRKGQFGDDPIAEAVLSRGNLLPAPQLVEDAMNMDSFKRIRGLLFDNRVGMIGVYGMGGVGKTTMSKEIYNCLLNESGPFDTLIWIAVSKVSTLQKLQEDIAMRVGLNFSTDNENERAFKLSSVLSRRKKVLLVLDDLWEAHSLESIGIPRPTQENGCKVVIASRSLDICRRMETDEEVEIKLLSEDEAWSLFRAKVGAEVLTSPAIESIAKEVAKECGGLPLAVVAVGRALHHATDISEWESTLEELGVSKSNINHMDEAVFSCLKLSFEKLRDDTSRSCFLYCALYPHGHLIDTNELIEHWMWKGALGEVNKISQSKSKGRIILNGLKHACMLESSTENGVERVKMHDLMRDKAISIMNTNPHCIVNAGTRLTKLTRLSEWTEDVQWVSLMRNDLKSMNFNPNCPQLSSLLLQYNSLEENIIPRDFFNKIVGLKVLDLSYTGIASLPESLSSLQNLGALLLCNCWDPTEIPSLAKLTKLMVLDLSFARKIRELPHGMEQLINLRRLNISWTKIEFFPYGLLSNFSLLEELLTAYSGVFWVSNEMKDELAGACIEELILASTLSVVEINFLNFDIFGLYVESMHWSVLRTYIFIVGQMQISECLSYASRAVYIIGCSSSYKIPDNTMELHLNYCWITEPLNICAPLKACSITFCHVGKWIVDSEINNLSTLERMDLHYVSKMEMICEKTVGPGTLMNLKIINVSNCHWLKRMFTTQLSHEMKNLEEITIRSCLRMEYIIGGEDETMDRDVNRDTGRVNFPKLQRLKLYDMPKLKGAYDGIVACHSLCYLKVFECPCLNRLPPGLFGIGANQQFSSSPTLNYVKGSKIWWDSLEWDQPQTVSFLQPLLRELTPIEMYELFESNRKQTQQVDLLLEARFKAMELGVDAYQSAKS